MQFSDDERFQALCLYIHICRCLIEWSNTKPQAVSYSVQGFDVLSGELGPRILQCEGAHGQPQDLCTQVWFGKPYCQKMLFAKTSRFVFIRIFDSRSVLLFYAVKFKTTLCYGILSLRSCACVRLCHTELSNLLVMRRGVDRRVHSDSLSLNMTQLRFHQIKDREIVQVMRLTCHLYDTLLSAL